MPQTALLKLLVVDDHAGFRQTVRQIFEAMKMEITEASSGEEAVTMFAAQRSDWVVMDMRMPGMGGVKATEAICKLDPTARVIVISQFTETEFSEQAMRAGALAFVAKENIAQLVSLINAPPAGT